jgi:hypothetical protein
MLTEEEGRRMLIGSGPAGLDPLSVGLDGATDADRDTLLDHLSTRELAP